MSEKKNIEYTLSPTKEKPARKYRKGSKYDPILENYLESTKTAKNTLMRVNVPGKESNYIRTQLNKVITKNGYGITVSVVNNEVYLEKTLVKELKA